jgi:AcrR family transcriptional regulator
MGRPVLNVPRQQRSRESLEKVLAAGAELLREGGLEQFTIPEISQRAGVSPGLIYGRFANKDALLYLIHERTLEQISSDLESRLRPAVGDASALETLLRGLTRATSDVFRAHAVLLRIFFTLGGVDHTVMVQGAEWMTAASAQLLETLEIFRPEVRHPDPDRALRMCVQTILGACMRGVTIGHATPHSQPVYGLDWEATAEELPRMCAAYLLHP